MKNTKRLLALLLLAALCLSLAACGSSKPAESAAPAAEAPAESAEPAAEAAEPEAEEPAAEEAVADPELPVRVMTLNGTTGFGIAGLIADAAEGNAALNYDFSVETDASNITAALVSGDVDIAALPTNAAAALYNKTGGKVQVLALNTRGVLYVVSDGSEEISSLQDLDGKTVYAPAQNPTFIFRTLCDAAGVNVTIDNTYAQPADLNTAAASGEVALAVLPEPMVTIARAQNAALTPVLDVTAEWDKVFTPGSLVQGCVVVRTAFAAEHPAETAAFLEEYGKSVALLEEDPAAAAQAIEACGIFAKAAVAEKAIPRCNLCCITGADMQAALSAFLETMAASAPESIGGAVPAEDFYCILP
jgi:NitT/TauT family transport system substrate-binding protein